MKWFKVLVDFYVRSSIHVALCFTALFEIMRLESYHLYDSTVYAVAFLTVLVGYNIIKYAETLWEKRKFRFQTAILIVTITASLILFRLLLNESIATYWIFIIIAVISTLYVLPFYGGKNLRHYAYIKLLAVGISWWCLFYLFPQVSNNVIRAKTTDNEVFNTLIDFIYSMKLFFYTIALCIPFEIRDLKYDNRDLKTLPQSIGVQASKITAIYFLAVMLIIELTWQWYCCYIIDMIATFYIPYELVSIILISAVAIWYSSKNRSDYYASLFIEALPVVWLSFYWFFLKFTIL